MGGKSTKSKGLDPPNGRSPDVFMGLELEPDRQAVFQYPGGKFPGRKFLV